MANPNNLLRPPVLNALNEGPSTSQQATSNINMTNELRIIIESMVTRAVGELTENLVNSVRNSQPEAIVDEDQEIFEGLRNNMADLEKIPDVIKCIREFSGNPKEFSSWRKGVDRIIKMYESEIGSPKYFGILSVIRNKIVGHADSVLESYNTPLNWRAISKCLTMHYADKRDIGTLEYQMTSLLQGRGTIQQFYQAVYSNLSLILNKISCMEISSESLSLLSQTYRDKALDTFIRGLNGDLPKLLAMREPNDLPQALHLCLKLENQNFRTNYATNYNQYKHEDFSPRMNTRRDNTQNHMKLFNNQMISYPKHNFHPELAYIPRNQRPNFNQNANNNQYRYNQFVPPPRPVAPKPQPRPEPMEVDETLHSRNINYINRPNWNSYGKRPPPTGSNRMHKQQRNFNIVEKNKNNEETGKFVQRDQVADSAFLLNPNKSSLPYFDFKAENGDILKILIDY